MREQLREQPQLSGLRMALSQRLDAAGRFAESEAILREGLEVENAYVKSDVWAGLADHYVALGEMDSAADAYEKSLALLDEVTPNNN